MQKYIIYAASGLLLTGFGISVIGDAIAAKIAGGEWFLVGTLGLIIFNAGLCFFGEAVKLSVLNTLKAQK